MSSKKSKKKNAPMPQSSAGLMRFFEDETDGVKIPPYYIVGLTVSLIVVSIVLRVIVPV
ncbi:MAG: preprotein translocase subunit Sec61beta [Thermoproteota archaeon]